MCTPAANIVAAEAGSAAAAASMVDAATAVRLAEAEKRAEEAEAQAAKLKKLTVVALAAQTKVLEYDVLMRGV